MYSSFDRYLDVNLSSGEIRDYSIPPSWTRLHLGGRGIAARILLEELSGGEDPLSPQNVIVFATGPFQGTNLLGAGRHLVMAISPKTGSICGSYVGGYFGHELGRSGYDGIIVRGAAEEPQYLTLIGGEAELCSAEGIWGEGTSKTEEALLEKHGGGRVCSIGIAGENLVRMACIINDRSRSAGRPGLGAVMGSKKLKAILVKGGFEKQLFDRERFLQERREYVEAVFDDSAKELGKYGTGGGLTWLSEMGILPTRNFQQGEFDRAESIGGQVMYDTVLVGREACAGCPIRCKRVVSTKFGGNEVLPQFGGPEYETLAAFGSLCDNADLDSICMANQLCNDYGIDTISAGVAAAFLMEASEKGLIEEKMPWGDGGAIVSLVEGIAHRQGLGGRVADGLQAFSEELGAEFCMAIKGVAIPMHEPRGKQGLGISYATSPRGATHLEGLHDTMLEIPSPAPELGIDHPYDRFTLLDKPDVAKTYEDLRSFENSLILCVFTVKECGEAYSLPRIRSLLEAATGIELTAKEMLEVGERNYALMRLHAARYGYTTDTDGLPGRFNEALPSGGSAGHAIKPEEMNAAIEEYYKLRGYDNMGPTDETLRQLGLEDCAGRIRR